MSSPSDLRVITFLKESNAIEDIHNIDYSKQENRDPAKGHFGAYILAQRAADERVPLTLKMICDWQALITAEQIEAGHMLQQKAVGHIRDSELPVNVRVGPYFPPSFEEVPERLAEWLEKLNRDLAKPDIDDIEYIRILGDALQEFEAIHPFVDGNGRTGRVLTHFIARWFHHPDPIIRFNERQKFYKAHTRKLAMRLFMAEKIQEAVYSPRGNLMTRIGGDSLTGTYQSNHEQLVVEWHHVVDAVEQWEKELERKTHPS